MNNDIELKDLTVPQLIKMGIEIRDDLKVESDKYNQFEKSTKDMLDRISQALKNKADEMGGVNSFATSEGTAYRTLKESYRVGSWPEVLKFIQDTHNYQMLEKRIGKLATKEIHSSTGQLPPGVEYIAEEEFVIRRPT